MRKSSRKNQNRPLFHTNSKEKNWGGDGTLICPDSVRVKLPFTQTLTPGTTAGGLYLYQYRGNSGFDPDYTGVGLQPNGFDQWAQFYNLYVVVSSEIVVEFMAGTSACVELVVVPAFNTTSAANTKEAAGWRYAKTNLFATIGNGEHKKIRHRMSTAEICGVPEEQVLYDSAYASTVSTNPGNNQTWYWDIFLQAINASTTLADTIRVTLYFDIKFMAPVQQAFSAVRRPVLRPCLEQGARTFTAGAIAAPQRGVVDDVCGCAACRAKAALRAFEAPSESICNRQ